MTSKLLFNLLWRFVLLILTSLGVVLLAFRVLEGEMIFTLVVGLILLGIQVYFLSRFILHTHKVLVKFIDSVGSDVASELQFSERHPYLKDLESRLNELKSAVSLSRFEQRKNIALLHTVVDAMDPGLICINQDGEVVFTNMSARTLVQHVPVFSLADIEKQNPALAEALDTSRKCSGSVATLPRFKALVRCSPFLIGGEKLKLFSIQDIQKEVDTQETESWQKLIRVLTHEIMNSLGPILSLSKSLKKSTGQQDKLVEGLSAIEQTGEGLIRFIREYRKLSTLPPPEKEVISVSSLFHRIESLFIGDIGIRKAGIEFLLEDQELELRADRQQIDQVLINLIRNALESLEGAARGKVVLRALKDADSVLIQVEDNGPGVPDNLRDQIFVPFYTTKKEGSGIGLSLSRQIMHNHGGSIGFSSAPGERTIFSVQFS